jgi:membrane protease YdiL (CAAX protease family)
MKFGVTRLQERFPAWQSCLVVGLSWGLWYLPMIFLGEGVPDGVPWPVFLISMFSLTVLLSWTYNETHSGLVLLIMQILSNCAFFMVPILPSGPGLDPAYVVAFVCMFLVVAAIILWVAGPEHLCTTGPRATWSASEGMGSEPSEGTVPFVPELAPTKESTQVHKR